MNERRRMRSRTRARNRENERSHRQCIRVGRVKWQTAESINFLPRLSHAHLSIFVWHHPNKLSINSKYIYSIRVEAVSLRHPSTITDHRCPILVARHCHRQQPCIAQTTSVWCREILCVRKDKINYRLHDDDGIVVVWKAALVIVQPPSRSMYTYTSSIVYIMEDLFTLHDPSIHPSVRPYV